MVHKFICPYCCQDRRIAELEERLQQAEGLLREILDEADDFTRRTGVAVVSWTPKVRAFLNPTPPQPIEPDYIPHLHCPKCEAPVDYPKGTTLIRTSDGQPTLVDMVLVRRDDLETILYDWIRDDCKYHPESHTAYDRLKAALDTAGKE